MAIELSPIDEPAPTSAPVEAEVLVKRGRGRPVGSSNKPKVTQAPPEVPMEPAPETTPEQTAETTPEQTAETTPGQAPEPTPERAPTPKATKPRAKPAPKRAPEPEPEPEPEPAPKKKRAVRLPPPAPVPIPVVPETRPEDLLRKMHLDARQRIGDSFTARRDAWSQQLNAKYK
jgi:hypothetical protein